MSNVKVLWFASPDFRGSGKWKPKTPFYLDPGVDGKPAVPKNCHVLYATPVEALVSCREHLIERFRLGAGTAFIQLYKVRLHITRDKYLLTPEEVEPYGFFDDFDVLPRYLCKTYQLFERMAWLKVKGPRYSKEPFDLWWKRIDEPETNAKFLIPFVTVDIEHRFFEWGSMPEKTVVEKHFDIVGHDWKCDIALFPHNPKLMERKRDRSDSLGQQGQTVSPDQEADLEIQEVAERSDP